MTENLNVSTFRNGDSIPEAKTDYEWVQANTNRQPAWCYYNNIPNNGVIYGKIYNWYAVNDPRGLAPQGYHIPTHIEFEILNNNLKMGAITEAGKKMKSTTGWYPDGNGTNTSGFSGVPGGQRYKDGSFSGDMKVGYFWSSSIDIIYPVCYYLHFKSGWLMRQSNDKESGFSVRCLRD